MRLEIEVKLSESLSIIFNLGLHMSAGNLHLSSCQCSLKYTLHLRVTEFGP